MSTFPLPIASPLVNGYRWDFSSITFNASGVPLPGLQSIDYGQEQKKGDVYANGSPQKIGQTVGQNKPSLSFDILALEYEALIFNLCALNGTPGSGYMTVRWDLRIDKQDGSGLTVGQVFTDICHGVSLDKISKGYKMGPEGLLTKCECSLIYLEENAQVALTVNPATQFMVLG